MGKGGVVKDPDAQHSAVDKVDAVRKELGARKIEAIDSPILGAEGNREFLLRGMLLINPYPVQFPSHAMGTSLSEQGKLVGIISKPSKPELANIVPGLLDWLLNNRCQIRGGCRNRSLCAGDSKLHPARKSGGSSLEVCGSPGWRWNPPCSRAGPLPGRALGSAGSQDTGFARIRRGRG